MFYADVAGGSGGEYVTITTAQVRAARALLDWSQPGLATRANVATSTVSDFERGARTPIDNNLAAMQKAFEDAGVVFIKGGCFLNPFMHEHPKARIE